MRPNIRGFVGLAESVFDLPQPIYEFGSLQVEGQDADLRGLFPVKTYVGCDFRGGKGVDRVENVQAISLPDASVGSVILVDTLEHVEKPEAALREIARVLKPGGVLVLSSVMDFPIHNYPHDYWRFTPQGFAVLLSVFPQAALGWQGYEKQPHTVFGLGFKSKGEEAKKGFARFQSRLGEISVGERTTSFKKNVARWIASTPPVKKGNYLNEIFAKFLDFEKIHFEWLAEKTSGS